MNDPIDSVLEKVLAIFRELVGDRAGRLDCSEISEPAREALATALAADYGEVRAADIAHHLADWNWDAAFMVAMHLFPERFTSAEIDAGVGLFLCHAPNHIREACRLTGQHVWDIFPVEDETCPLAEPHPQPLMVTRVEGKGRGVRAARRFSSGEIIERTPVIVIPREDVPLIRQTRLAHYYFEWGADCQEGAIALGCGSLYNHSYSPNARYVFRESEECIEIVALRDIGPGEEITINYNNLEESAANPLKFDVH